MNNGKEQTEVMEIFDLAAKLGQALKADPRLIALEEAKKLMDQ